VTVETMRAADWPAVAAIYAEGLEAGTFETEVPFWDDWNEAHLDSPRVVAREGGEVCGWAALAPYSARPVYRGVAEDSVYVARSAQRRGVGRLLLAELVRRSEDAGIWTLQASCFVENAASIRLHESCGFRIVGTRERLAKRNEVWRDVVLLERRSHVVQ
jgi:phosphinothricin acetyltransferase